MIERGRGSLLEADVDALVNTVNCVGVMGRGVALAVKAAYPRVYAEYRRACEEHLVQPGKMLTILSGRRGNPQYIINFPTKRHWKGKSRLADIKAGLPALVDEVNRLRIESVAVPALGCGNGGLDWAVVRPLIVDAFEALPDARVVLFDPPGTGSTSEQADGHVDVIDPDSRALLQILRVYSCVGYPLTLREVRRIAYLLQETGAPLGLRFDRGGRRPTATAVAALLQPLVGHYLHLLEPINLDSEVQLTATDGIALCEAGDKQPEAPSPGERVIRLIQGFEDPHGLEVLVAVHRAAHEKPLFEADTETIIGAAERLIHGARPLTLRRHLLVAWQRLSEHGWLPSSVGADGVRFARAG